MHVRPGVRDVTAILEFVSEFCRAAREAPRAVTRGATDGHDQTEARGAGRRGGGAGREAEAAVTACSRRAAQAQPPPPTFSPTARPTVCWLLRGFRLGARGVVGGYSRGYGRENSRGGENSKGVGRTSMDDLPTLDRPTNATWPRAQPRGARSQRPKPPCDLSFATRRRSAGRRGQLHARQTLFEATRGWRGVSDWYGAPRAAGALCADSSLARRARAGRVWEDSSSPGLLPPSRISSYRLLAKSPTSRSDLLLSPSR